MIRITGTWGKMGLSAAAGIIVGVLTVLAQGVLPGNWNSLANSGTVWLIPTFFAGALGSTKGKAAVFGVTSLIGMVAGYYGYAMLVQQVAHSLYFISIWMCAALIGGVIFGIAGFLWSRGKGRSHKYGSALIGGVFITEGLNLFIHLDSYRHMQTVGVAQMIIGIILILVLERSAINRASSLAALLPVVILGLAGYAVLFQITN